MRGIRSVVLAALSGVALVGFMASAQAASVTTSGDIVTITFTGTVSSSTDPYGIFGCTDTTCEADNPDGPDGGGPYGGESYTAEFTFNTGVGYTGDYPGSLVYAEGGSSMIPDIEFGNPPAPPPSPLVGDATVTVNGVTYDLGGSYYAVLQNSSSDLEPNATPYTLFAEVYDSAGNTIFGQVQTTTDPPQFPVSITTPFSADFGQYAYSYIDFDCTGGVCGGNIYGDMSVSLVNDSTVPEPSTWVMMSVGFAGLAFAGYRRTRTAA
jgi:PEP-CTERM motif